MRKRSKIQTSFLPRVASSIVVPEHLSTREYTVDSRSNMEKYHTQISQANHSPIINFRVNKNRNKDLNSTNLKPSIIHNLNQVTKQIKSLRNDIKERRYSKIDRIDRMITEVQANSSAKRMNSQYHYPPPVFYPIPFPIYMPQPHQPHSYSNPKEKVDSFYRKQSFRNSHYQNHNRVRKNMKRFRKIANCVLFIIYLRRFCRIVRLNRKIGFDKFMTKISGQLKLIKKVMNDSLAQFYTIMRQKAQISYEIEEDDSSKVKRQKQISLKKLIALIFELIHQSVKIFINKVELVESLYLLCRHGNYSCTQALLTKQQLEIMCISESFNYVSANKILEKVALTNLIFIKLLIYNSLLSPQKISEALTQQQIPNNLYIIASIIYEFVIDYQDQSMMKISPIYQLGNYREVQNVRVLEPIIVKDGIYHEGQIISGLKSEQWVKQYFNFRVWGDIGKNLSGTINLMHNAISKYHLKVTKPFF